MLFSLLELKTPPRLSIHPPVPGKRIQTGLRYSVSWSIPGGEITSNVARIRLIQRSMP